MLSPAKVFLEVFQVFGCSSQVSRIEQGKHWKLKGSQEKRYREETACL